ncbi:MAG: hypothetical protein ACRCSO_01015, partial [Sphingomonas sp.]
TLTGANGSSIYNGTSQSNGAATLSGVQGTDSFAITGIATGTNAGRYTDQLGLVATGGTLASNYTLTVNNGALTIALPTAMNLSGINAAIVQPRDWLAELRTPAPTPASVNLAALVLPLGPVSNGSGASTESASSNNFTNAANDQWLVSSVEGALWGGKTNSPMCSDSDSTVARAGAGCTMR